MRARARVMSEVEEVQEQMKVDIEAMKDQMAAMMEAILSMKKIMEVNVAAVVATNVVAEVDPTPPSGLNQINHPTSDMVGPRGKELGSTNDPHFNVNNSTPILIESQQPQSDHVHVSQPMGETHEIPHHNLVDFKPRFGYATKGQVVGGVPLPNTLEGPQFCPQPQPFHFAVGRVLLAMDLEAQVAPPMTEREMITMIVDTLSVFYYEKMVAYTPSSFANLVFAGEMIKVGLKRGKFDHPALTNKKPGANRKDEKEEGTHAVTVIPTWANFPPAQQCHYAANISPSHYPPPYQPRTPNQPQRPPLNQPQGSPVGHPIPNTNQNTDHGGNFPTKKHVEFTPILVSYANLLPYLLDNSIVAITPAKVPQPPFF
ncbi:hypothetical protein HKD37_20G056093 [Glycine soja]